MGRQKKRIDPLQNRRLQIAEHVHHRKNGFPQIRGAVEKQCTDKQNKYSKSEIALPTDKHFSTFASLLNHGARQIKYSGLEKEDHMTSSAFQECSVHSKGISGYKSVKEAIGGI